MITGTRLITEERERQLKDWSPDHDLSEHKAGDLSVVAAHLAVEGTDAVVTDPLERGTWGLLEKYKDRELRRLVIAGALIAAEIDRVTTEQTREAARK